MIKTDRQKENPKNTGDPLDLPGLLPKSLQGGGAEGLGLAEHVCRSGRTRGSRSPESAAPTTTKIWVGLGFQAYRLLGRFVKLLNISERISEDPCVVEPSRTPARHLSPRRHLQAPSLHQSGSASWGRHKSRGTVIDQDLLAS